MRVAILLTITLATLSMATTCIPLIQTPGPTPSTPTQLGLTILTPTRDATVGQGSVIPIHWKAFNQSKSAVTARLWVESRVDLKTTTLVEGVSVIGTLDTTQRWDTTGFDAGAYVIYAELTGTDTQVTAPGRITVDLPPTFAFTEPTETTTLTSGNTLTIGWNGADAEGTGQISIGLDTDSNHESGNELFIRDETLGKTATDASFAWDGKDLSGDTVPEGTYNLFASVSDGVNPVRFVDADADVIIPTSDGSSSETVTLGITDPADDTTFLRGTTLDINFTVNQFEDVIIDLKIDTDDTHTNGNEATILSQRLITGGTKSDSFTWDGTYAAGTQVPPGTPDDRMVPDGIYRLYIVMNTGSGTPQTADGTGLILRRTTEKQPLIGMLQPSSQQTVTAGSYVSITWRTDDPDKTATVRLTVDNDALPGHEESGDTFPELTILSDRPTGTSALQNSFTWQVPASLSPGTYYFFGYTVLNGTDQQNSIAPGQIIIKNPTSRP